MIKIINISFVLLLLPWLFFAFGSIFAFDSGRHMNTAWLLVLAIWSYPIIVLVSWWLSNRYSSIYIALLPLVNILIIFSIFFLVFPHLEKNDEQLRKQMAETRYNTASRDFVCSETEFIHIDDKKRVLRFDNVNESAKSGIYIADLLPEGIFFGGTYYGEPELKDVEEHVKSYAKCKNKDGKSLTEVYGVKTTF